MFELKNEIVNTRLGLDRQIKGLAGGIMRRVSRKDEGAPGRYRDFKVFRR